MRIKWPRKVIKRVKAVAPKPEEKKIKKETNDANLCNVSTE